MLSNYTGKVDLTRVREGLDKLQSLYRQSGFSERQRHVAGTKIHQRACPHQNRRDQCRCGIRFGRGHHQSFCTRKPKPTIEVRGYQIEGNTALPAGEFNFLTNYIGEVGFRPHPRRLGQIAIALSRTRFSDHQRHAAAAETDQRHRARESHRGPVERHRRRGQPVITAPTTSAARCRA